MSEYMTLEEAREIARKEICRYGIVHAYKKLRELGWTELGASRIVADVYEKLSSRSDDAPPLPMGTDT